MSYHFDQLLSNQAGFESTEQLFCNFLQSIIKIIIEPFRISYQNNKFNNVPKQDLDAINQIFIIIEQMYKFHNIARDKLSLILAETTLITNTTNKNKIHSPTSHSSHSSHPSHPKRRHYRGSGHSKSSSFSPQISSIFEYYQSFPKYYKQFFHQILCSLKLLSQIITPRTNLKKWIRSKCEQIFLLKPEQKRDYHIINDNSNNSNNNIEPQNDDKDCNNNQITTYECLPELSKK